MGDFTGKNSRIFRYGLHEYFFNKGHPRGGGGPLGLGVNIQQHSTYGLSLSAIYLETLRKALLQLYHFIFIMISIFFAPTPPPPCVRHLVSNTKKSIFPIVTTRCIQQGGKKFVP